jgi:T5SS/PEP-CTERM-associated repeat protein
MSARYRPNLIFLLCVLFCNCATALPLAAQNYNWSPLFPSGSSFGQGFNWSPGGGPPGESGTAVFNTGAASTATFNYNPFNASLLHQSGDTIFKPSGTNATYSLNGASLISGGSLTINPDGIFRLDVRFSGLTLSGDSELNINAGEVSNVGALDVGSGSAGTINVNGSAASFTSSFTGQNTLGFGGNGYGSLNFSNGATGSMAGSLRIGGGPAAGGDLNVLSGSTFSFGSANVANGSAVDQIGTIQVAGTGSTITQTGNSFLTLGKASSGNAALFVQGGGTYNTGTGLTTVNATGQINVFGGDFNANGNVIVNGGKITRTSGNFNLAAGRTLTANDGAEIRAGTLLSGGTSWSINSGSFLYAANIANDAQNTTVTIDGNGSSFNSAVNDDLYWGRNGGTAIVNVQNGATASLGRIFLARSTAAGTTGIFNVENGASVTSTLLFVADLGGETTTGTVNVTGPGSSMTLSPGGSGVLVLGHADGGSATLNVLNGGTFTSGTGSIVVNATGSINIGRTDTSHPLGTFYANGNVDVNGGSISSIDGNFLLAADRTFTAQNDAQLEFSFTRINDSTWNILSGSVLDAGLSNIGTSGDGTLTVDGTGSSFNAAGGSTWGVSGNTALVTVRNGATASIGGILGFANSDTAGSSASLVIENGAAFMTTGSMLVATSGGATTTGAITVSGNGSSLTQTGDSYLSFGHATSGTATLNVLDGGTVSAGSLGTILNATGTINIDGGFANLGLLNRQGGALNFLAGSLDYDGDLTVGSGGLLGNGSLTLESNRHLALTGTTTVNSFQTLKLDGGSFSTGDLDVQSGGVFDFQKGTLGLTGTGGLTVGSGGALGDLLHVNNLQTYNIGHTATVASDGVLSVGSGGRFNAQTLNNFGEVIMGGNLARITTSPLNTFNNHGLLSGAGRIDGDLYNHAGGIVELESGKRLTFTDHVTNLAGGRIIGRGQLVAPSVDNYGQLLFSGGFTDIQAPITGFAGSQMILTGGGTTTVFGDVEIKGDAELRISELSNGVFFDHVQLRNGALITGDGNAFFEGSLGIGDSPSRQEFSFNVTFGATSNLIMEIAGTDPLLPEFDQFIFLQNLTLQGGALTVDLIGLNPGDPNYMPLAGDSFQFLEVYGNWTGTFGTLNLPKLAGGLHWNTSQLYSHGTLSVSAIPEPGAGLMLLAVLMGLMVNRRR